MGYVDPMLVKPEDRDILLHLSMFGDLPWRQIELVDGTMIWINSKGEQIPDPYGN